MSSKTKKIIGGLFLSVLILGMALCFALTQPKFLAQTILYFSKNNPAELIIKELTIESLNWRSWNYLKLNNVRIKCKFKGATYFISSGEMIFEHLNGVVTKKPIGINIRNLALVSDSINASDMMIDAEIFFEHSKFKKSEGEIYAQTIELDRYGLNQFKGRFKVNLAQIDLEDIHAEFYQGSIKGEIIVAYTPKINYSVFLHLDNIDLNALSQANPSIFENMKGTFSGDILVKGSPHLIQYLKIGLNSLEGNISSKILMLMAEVLPKGNIFRQAVDSALKNQDSIRFEKWTMVIGSNGLEKYQAKVNIHSAKAAVDLRYTYDINIPGGLSAILKFLQLIKN